MDCGALRRREAAPLCAALLGLVDSPAAEFPYDPVYGDAYNSRERELERTLGPAAGRLHLGRTRREAGRIAFRLALRDRLLGLHADVTAVRRGGRGPGGRARGHAVGGHHLPPARAAVHVRALPGQLRRAGACATWTGSRPPITGPTCRRPGRAGRAAARLPLDRDRLAARLGFAAVGPHTRDAMWSADALTDAVAAAAQAAATVSQLACDLEIFASPAFGYLALPASLCRASVLMPQKRNPYALPVLRGGAGTLIGRLTGLLATGLTPSARTDNWLYAYGEVAGALDLAGQLIRLGAAVVSGLTVNADVLAEQAASHFTGAADLAEELTQRFRLDYRTAYRVVGRAVAAALDRGETELTGPAVAAAAEEITGTDAAGQRGPAGRGDAGRPGRVGPGRAGRREPAPGRANTRSGCGAGWPRPGSGTPAAGRGTRPPRPSCWPRPERSPLLSGEPGSQLAAQPACGSRRPHSTAARSWASPDSCGPDPHDQSRSSATSAAPATPVPKYPGAPGFVIVSSTIRRLGSGTRRPMPSGTVMSRPWMTMWFSAPTSPPGTRHGKFWSSRITRISSRAGTCAASRRAQRSSIWSMLPCDSASSRPYSSAE